MLNLKYSVDDLVSAAKNAIKHSIEYLVNFSPILRRLQTGYLSTQSKIRGLINSAIRIVVGDETRESQLHNDPYTTQKQSDANTTPYINLKISELVANISRVSIKGGGNLIR